MLPGWRAAKKIAPSHPPIKTSTTTVKMRTAVSDMDEPGSVIGWTRPKLRDPAAADRWTWLILAYAQLRLARPLAADLRLPWQRPCPPGRLTPARVRRGFRNIRQMLPCRASAPKPGKPGPGRPPGSKNRRPATRHDVGKTAKRDQPKKKTRRQKG